MALDNTGNLGIGTASPGYKLDVNGTMAATIMYDRDNTGYYVDPNGLSVMSQVSITNGMSVTAVGLTSYSSTSNAVSGTTTAAASGVVGYAASGWASIAAAAAAAAAAWRRGPTLPISV
jgi:uncharacterized membrane protein